MRYQPGLLADEASTVDSTGTNALARIHVTLTRRYPSAPSEYVAELLRSSYDRTRDASVQDFRLVLAERETLERLRSEGYVYRRS